MKDRFAEGAKTASLMEQRTKTKMRSTDVKSQALTRSRSRCRANDRFAEGIWNKDKMYSTNVADATNKSIVHRPYSIVQNE